MLFDIYLQDVKNLSLREDENELHDKYPGSSCGSLPFL